jgi:hypothetical protein
MTRTSDVVFHLAATLGLMLGTLVAIAMLST